MDLRWIYTFFGTKFGNRISSKTFEKTWFPCALRNLLDEETKLPLLLLFVRVGMDITGSYVFYN